MSKSPPKPPREVTREDWLFATVQIASAILKRRKEAERQAQAGQASEKRGE